jgi:preprotein translocase subunit SecD
LFAHKNLYFANPVRLVNGCNMKRRRQAFNTYFLGLCICWLPFVGEAATSTNEVKKTEEVKKKKSKKKEISTVRVHLEVPRDTSGRSSEVPILRENSMLINVEKQPFLTEGFLAEAKVIDTPGGKEIELHFNTLGQTALGNYTAANRGRRLAIFCEFEKERRWLAAPKITKLLPDGILRFTPDANAEEIERIVRGLNTIAEIKKKKDKF